MLDELKPLARRHLRRNFNLGVANGALFSFGDALQDTNLVLSVFISQLSGSNVLVGLLQPVRLGGWFLPQLLVSCRLQGVRAKMPYYRLGALLRSSGAFGMAVVALLVSDPRWLVPLTFVMLAFFSLNGGLSGLAFTDIVGKTIPSRMRGRYYAWRIFTGGLLALGASYIVRYVLGGGGGLAFPRNYGLLFMIGAIGISTGMGAFAFVREPADDRVRPPASVWAQLCRAWALPARDANYRGFLAGRLCLMLAEVAAPFYIIYARSAFGLPDTVVGTYILVGTVANIASTYAWGRISDTAGNRRVLLRASALGALAPLLALAALPALGPRQGGWLPTLAVGVVFALLGAARTGVNIGAPNLLLDVAPADDRPIYVGLTNTSVGIATLATALGGVLVDALGYSALFAAALALYLLATLALSRMREPREVVERRLEQAAV